MEAENYIIADGKKYLWDGLTYNDREEAKAKAESYEKNDFETHIIEGAEHFLVYTRRIVTEIVLDGEVPP